MKAKCDTHGTNKCIQDVVYPEEAHHQKMWVQLGFAGATGPGPRMRFAGVTQAGWGPEYWGISMEQLSGIAYDGKRMNMYGLTDFVVKPATAGLGVGYALKLNSAKPVLARTMVQ